MLSQMRLAAPSPFSGELIPRINSFSLELMSAGQISDYTGAAALLREMPEADWLIADRGYDADWFRDALKDKEIKPCIPGRKQRKTSVKYDKRRLERRSSYVTRVLRALRPRTARIPVSSSVSMNQSAGFVSLGPMAFTSATTPTPEQPIDLGQAAQKPPRADVVADLAHDEEQVERAPFAVADGVQPAGQAASGSADQGSLAIVFRSCPSWRHRFTPKGRRRDTGASAFFRGHTGRGPVGFQIRRVGHDRLFLAVIGCQTSHHLRKDALVAPSLPAVAGPFAGLAPSGLT